MGMAPSYRRVRFGSFEMDEIAGELCKDGAKIRLQEQPFQILQILLEHPGEVVTREELRKRVWPSDTFVDFDHGINNAIKRLREALGDTAETPHFIATQKQPSQVLRILLERAGEIVTREELRQTIWASDTFVDFDHGINNAIKRLREAISKSQEEREVSLRFGGLGSRSGDASSYRRNVPQVQIRKNP
jgi:DNA-binding winged helix-turn-helix (wHTH) protein